MWVTAVTRYGAQGRLACGEAREPILVDNRDCTRSSVNHPSCSQCSQLSTHHFANGAHRISQALVADVHHGATVESRATSSR